MHYGIGANINPNDPLLKPSGHDIWNRGVMTEVAKRMLGGHAVNPGSGHPKIEVGEVDAGDHGRLRVSLDQSADVVNIHGVPVHLSEITRRDLRAAVVASAAAFSKAISDQEQAEQRAIVGAVVAAVLREHPDIGARVNQIKVSERYD